MDFDLIAVDDVPMRSHTKWSDLAATVERAFDENPRTKAFRLEFATVRMASAARYGLITRWRRDGLTHTVAKRGATLYFSR